MSKIVKLLLAIALIIIADKTSIAGEKLKSFSSYVDIKGAISMPEEFRASWAHLGSWVVTSQQATGMGYGSTDHGTGIHNVYTQPDSLRAYKKDRTWPDGSILIMEVRSLKWDDLPTGHVIFEGDPIRCFVMVKDTKGRFADNPAWGDGWGWALFKQNAPNENLSKNYKDGCLGCHEVAKDTDGFFIHGYPPLRKE